MIGLLITAFILLASVSTFKYASSMMLELRVLRHEVQDLRSRPRGYPLGHKKTFVQRDSYSRSSIVVLFDLSPLAVSPESDCVIAVESTNMGDSKPAPAGSLTSKNTRSLPPRKTFTRSSRPIVPRRQRRPSPLTSEFSDDSDNSTSVVPAAKPVKPRAKIVSVYSHEPTQGDMDSAAANLEVYTAPTPAPTRSTIQDTASESRDLALMRHHGPLSSLNHYLAHLLRPVLSNEASSAVTVLPVVGDDADPPTYFPVSKPKGSPKASRPASPIPEIEHTLPNPQPETCPKHALPAPESKKSPLPSKPIVPSPEPKSIRTTLGPKPSYSTLEPKPSLEPSKLAAPTPESKPSMPKHVSKPTVPIADSQKLDQQFTPGKLSGKSAPGKPFKLRQPDFLQQSNEDYDPKAAAYNQYNGAPAKKTSATGPNKSSSVQNRLSDSPSKIDESGPGENPIVERKTEEMPIPQAPEQELPKMQEPRPLSHVPKPDPPDHKPGLQTPKSTASNVHTPTPEPASSKPKSPSPKLASPKPDIPTSESQTSQSNAMRLQIPEPSSQNPKPVPSKPELKMSKIQSLKRELQSSEAESKTSSPEINGNPDEKVSRKPVAEDAVAKPSQNIMDEPIPEMPVTRVENTEGHSAKKEVNDAKSDDAKAINPKTAMNTEVVTPKEADERQKETTTSALEQQENKAPLGSIIGENKCNEKPIPASPVPSSELPKTPVSTQQPVPYRRFFTPYPVSEAEPGPTNTSAPVIPPKSASPVPLSETPKEPVPARQPVTSRESSNADPPTSKKESSLAKPQIPEYLKDYKAGNAAVRQYGGMPTPNQPVNGSRTSGDIQPTGTPVSHIQSKDHGASARRQYGGMPVSNQPINDNGASVGVQPIGTPISHNPNNDHGPSARRQYGGISMSKQPINDNEASTGVQSIGTPASQTPSSDHGASARRQYGGMPPFNPPVNDHGATFRAPNYGSTFSSNGAVDHGAAARAQYGGTPAQGSNNAPAIDWTSIRPPQKRGGHKGHRGGRR